MNPLIIVIFFIAYRFGGWWWLIAIVVTVLYLIGKNQETKKQAPVVSQIGKTIDWVPKLTGICSNYTASNYYVGKMIPDTKLKNALKHYPPVNGKVIALMDWTTWGSADKGLLISEHGLSWKQRSFDKHVQIKWEDIAKLGFALKGYDTQISIGGNPAQLIDFNGVDGGSKLNADKTFNLLSDVISLMENQWATAKQPSGPRPNTDKPIRHNADQGRGGGLGTPSGTGLIDINRATFDELLSLPGLGAAEAKMVRDRQASGGLRSHDELVEFLGLKPHQALRLKSKITFSEAAVSNPSAAANRPPVQGGRLID